MHGVSGVRQMEIQQSLAAEPNHPEIATEKLEKHINH
jgi:hypothetical protein